jgi:hypothetical protein
MHGNDGMAFCKGDLGEFWAWFLNQPFLTDREKDVLRIQVTDLNKIRASYR